MQISSLQRKIVNELNMTLRPLPPAALTSHCENRSAVRIYTNSRSPFRSKNKENTRASSQNEHKINFPISTLQIFIVLKSTLFKIN